MSTSWFAGKKPKKGEATAKQRLGKKLKIHKIGGMFQKTHQPSNTENRHLLTLMTNIGLPGWFHQFLTAAVYFGYEKEAEMLLSLFVEE